MKKLNPEGQAKSKAEANERARARFEHQMNKAAVQGYKARSRKLPKGVNPFSAETQPNLHKAWDRGFELREEELTAVIDDHELAERGPAVTFILNGRSCTNLTGFESYDDIVARYSATCAASPNVLVTITYSDGPLRNQSGSLCPGESVEIINGMIFNATITNNS